MKKTVILLKSNYFINDNKECDFFNLDEIKKTFSKRVKIIILDEELYIKSFKCTKLFNISSVVEEKIEEFFPQKGDILYDYENNPIKSLLYLYSIKGGDKVKKICENIKEIEVIPIQYIIRDVVKDISKNKKITCMSIVKLKERFYFIYLKNGVIEVNALYDDYNLIFNKINEMSDVNVIYLDNNIAGYIEKYNPKYLDDFNIIRDDIGEKVYERIYKK